MKRRVVVTGMGAATPIGVGLERMWNGILECRSGVDTIVSFDHSQFPVHFAAEVRDFDPLVWLNAKDARQLDRFVQFAIATAVDAVADSGLDLEGEDRERVGCIWASGIGGIQEFESAHSTYIERGPSRISPFFIPKMIINAAPGQIAIRLRIQGVNYGVASACASGQHAIGLALRAIQYGDADVVVTGGSEAAVSPMGLGGFCALRALSKRNEDPKAASRPFTASRDGFVLGEGAAALVLEEYEHATARGARIYGEVLGLGMTDDGHHISAPLPEGTMATRAIVNAVREAGIALEDVDYVNAHGTSTQLNDKMETTALHAAFGAHAKKLQVSSTKSQLGHLLGASGAVESVVTLLALERQVVPATINYTDPDPECDLDYVPNEPRSARLRYAVSNSFGFGGHNVTMVFGVV
jgi:3-oxoacyl-[acyl-carrier-protein] synthase II